MAKALKIESGRYLNMDHVVTFSLANETIEVTSTIQAFTSIHIGIKAVSYTHLTLPTIPLVTNPAFIFLWALKHRGMRLLMTLSNLKLRLSYQLV